MPRERLDAPRFAQLEVRELHDRGRTDRSWGEWEAISIATSRRRWPSPPPAEPPPPLSLEQRVERLEELERRRGSLID